MKNLLKKVALAPVFAAGFLYGMGKVICKQRESVQDVINTTSAESEETEWKVVRNIDEDDNRQYYMLPETAECPENMQVVLRGSKEQCEYFMKNVSILSRVKQ